MGWLAMHCAAVPFTLPSDVLSNLRQTASSRVQAMNVIAGDYGISGGHFDADNGQQINISKFGGYGVIGDPQPLGDLGIGWQPQLQGSMGYLTDKRTYSFSASDPAHVVNGDQNENSTYAIQFGGGAQFWLTDKLSFSPTIMGMYGHTFNDYVANSAFGQENYAAAKNAGLIGWSVNTWSVRPAGQLAYVETWKRTIFTLSSSGTYYYTQSFESSSPDFSFSGNSEAWENKLDVDVPTDLMVYNHEIRTGGYFSRSEYYGELENGLKTDYMYEIHGRVVLDFLGQLWKVQWLGVGFSYLWGADFHGISYGVDAAFQF